MQKIFNEVNLKIQQLVGFEEYGFEQESFFDYYTILLKTNNEASFKIVYSLFPFDNKSYLGQIRYGVLFPVVNKILYNVIGKFYQFEDTLIDSEGFQKSQELQNAICKLIVDGERVFENNLVESCQLFKSYLSTYISPFFDKIQTLQQANDEILEKVDWTTYNKYISGETGAKVLIIMKLCNNPRYDAYKERSDKLIAQQLNDPNYAQYKDILQNQQTIMDEVYDYLESGKYLDII